MADRTTGRRTATGSNPLTEVMEQSPSQLGVTRLGPLVEELKRQQESRLDAVIDSRQVMFVPPHNYSEKSDGLLLRPVDGTQAMEFVDSDGVALRKHALQQIAKTFHIPAKFLYDLSRSKRGFGGRSTRWPITSFWKATSVPPVGWKGTGDPIRPISFH